MSPSTRIKFMSVDFAAAMRRATQLTRAQDIAGAMRVIQTALAGGPATNPGHAEHEAIRSPHQACTTARLIDLHTEIVPPTAPEASASQPVATKAAGTSGTARLRKPLGEVLELLREGKAKVDAFALRQTLKRRRQPPPIPEGAQFLNRSFTCTAGARNYRLYIPASASERAGGLVVMLHGCKQDPDDFAAGTNMNVVAERYGVLVAYPGQLASANTSSCWNWFRPADQLRDAGEPAIIAGLTREIMEEFGLRRGQVFVAGLSAGGAMAAVMGETYPDLYAGVGIHSGLAYGVANDVVTAFAAMRGDTGAIRGIKPAQTGSESRIRTIVFQGSADAVVHPSNAERIINAAAPQIAPGAVRREIGASSAGRSYTRTVITAADGDLAVEYWLIAGAGHAWSGGNPSGSYADPAGPDASTEMMRFFFAQSPKISD
jgi:poly(hydroxyalkanoate) depolymerase family esterase